MALPDYIEATQGTAIVWGSPSGTGVTHNLSIDSLGQGSGWMGQYADLGANYADEYLVYFKVETGSAPTAGTSVELYLVCAYDISVANPWAAKVTGSDGLYTLGTSDANLKQAGAPVISLIATADSNTVLQQAPVIWRPRGRYVVPIVDNNLNQDFRNEATDSNNDTRIILVPRRRVISDT